ncbi:MAG: selenoneine synthase SenA [Chloroflexota bacterium]|nr:selenoneine synthase SenA [Chloroflexota bacterium]MDE2886047.1 selenoneine synthase SenA [Chloroflexota bacterium]
MSAYDLPPAPPRRTDELVEEALDSVETVLALTADLDARQQQGPMIPIVNPALWEVGHVGWFFEKWTLRNLYEAQSMVPHSDALYDSAAIAHDTRWRLSFPSWEETRAFARKIAREATGRLGNGEPDALEQYFIQLATIHTDMHAEAFTYTRQTLGFPEPVLGSTALPSPQPGFEPHDIAVPGGTFTMGAAEGELPFVFDNEKWGHEVRVEPFAMAATAVSNGEFLRFVEAGGYRDRSCWTDEGWWWKQALGAEHPVYWHRESDGTWLARRYDAWLPIDPHAAIIHVNWHEATAYCAWAGRRLPTEAEWELAAAGGADGAPKRLYPWGDERPTPERANLDFRGRGTVDVRALPEGDTPLGCRQMLGNAWEWTATEFGPYPGFVADPYKEYSEPWFSGHKVLRGGAWSTRSRLIRNTWRNFYTPDRRDVMCGFRTCAA